MVDMPTTPTPPNYKDTLNLPKTNFDMKANLVQREPAMLKAWQADDLYGKIRAARHGSLKGKWVLHDGPPYANGDIHMGHLINKVLKDIVVKFRTMQGYDSPYVPGWDCHGLPIESAIQKELGPKFRELSKDELRKKCHDYAMKFVKLQGDGFQRLGVFGDFARPYLTLDPKYEAGILDVLAELVKNDLVYRQKKPVHWCVNDRTALAEAELEYANKRDTSVYVMFPLIDLGAGGELGGEIRDEADQLLRSFGLDPVALREHEPILYVMIWTTTPWTLPANRAVAIHPDHEYVYVSFKQGSTNRSALIAKELVEKVMRVAGVTDYAVANGDIPLNGRRWASLNPQYRHPLEPSRLQPIVLADYVTLEDGTGLVHTAPGHGKEDYQTGIKYGLEVYNPVLADGRYDDTVPEFLRGKSIWDANKLVIEKLRENGTLFHAQEFDHSYPHCWRCKKPVIFRATEQWFVKASGDDGVSVNSQTDEPTLPNGRVSERLGGMEVAAQTGDATARISNQSLASAPGAESLRGSETRPLGSVNPGTTENSPLWSRAKKFVDSVQWIPAWGKNRIDGMLDTRPDWCISRQRSWGVPIPAFFDEQGNCLLTEKSVRRIAVYFKQHGADSWYTHTPAQLLGEETWTDTVFSPHGETRSAFTLQTSSLSKGMDILDVWFESGASHHAVLECTHPELGYPATMYLEGSDQHRGWFQSSLLEAAGWKSEPPFKQVLTHGFIVDQNGRKMSKSEGNDIKVADALKEYGADVLRLWVSSVDYQNDIPLSKELLKTIGESYRKIRNTIRYLLGNLYDFDPTKHTVAPEPASINAWMAGRAHDVFSDCRAAYDTYQFHNVYKMLYEFCNVEISATYAKAIKDRLYCELPDSPKRRAAQSVCYSLLLQLIELLAPVLVYTSEEAWAAVRALPGTSSLSASVHLHAFAAPASGDSVATHGLKLAKDWTILMPLVEKGNKQLDDLKKTVGLGNALDAEAVIILPSVTDEITAHIAHYGPEIEDALGVGYHRIEHGEIWDIKIHDTREKYPSCARSWKRRPDVGSDPAYPDLSARDAAVVTQLRPTN